MADHSTAELLPALENIAQVLLKRCHQAATLKCKSLDRLTEDEFHDIVVGSNLIPSNAMHYVPLLRSLMLIELKKNPSLLAGAVDIQALRRQRLLQQQQQQQQLQQRHVMLTRSQAPRAQSPSPMDSPSSQDSKTTDSDDSYSSDGYNSLTSRQQDDLEDERKWLNIQRLPSGMYRVNDRLYFDTRTYTGFNFVGRMLGHGGCTIKRLEKLTHCRMQIRGKGSIRNPADEARLRKEAGHEHLKEDLHIIFEAEDVEEAHAVMRIKNCRQFLVPYMQPTSEESLSLKAEQEREALSGKLKMLAGPGKTADGTPAVVASDQAGNITRGPGLTGLHADAKPFQPSGFASSTALTNSLTNALTNSLPASLGGSGDSITTPTELMMQQRLAMQSHLITQQQHQLQQLTSQNNQLSQQQHNMVLRSQATVHADVLTSADATASSAASSSAISTQQRAHEECGAGTGGHFTVRRSIPISCTTTSPPPTLCCFSARGDDDDNYTSGYAETSDYGSCSDGSGTPTGVDDVFHRNAFFDSGKENNNEDSGNGSDASRTNSVPHFARTPGAGRKGAPVGVKARYRSSPVLSPRNNLLLPEGKLPGWSPLDGGPLRLLRDRKAKSYPYESPQLSISTGRRKSIRLSARA